MALGDRLGGKVRSVVRRARRDGPLDIVFVLFNADGMGGTARSGIEQANALARPRRGPPGPDPQRHGAAARRPTTRWPTGSRSPTSSTYAVSGPPRSTAGTPTSWPTGSRSIVPRSWDALYNGADRRDDARGARRARRRRARHHDARAAGRRRPARARRRGARAPGAPRLLGPGQRPRRPAGVRPARRHRGVADRVDVALAGRPPRRCRPRAAGDPQPAARHAAGALAARPEDLRHRRPARAGEAVRAPRRRVLAHPRGDPRLDADASGATARAPTTSPRRSASSASRTACCCPASTDDLAAEWARASVAVLASRGEGYPLVLQEAMSAGVPPVSYDCPSGPREMITHDVDGLLVPPASKAAMAAAMLRIATDDDLRTRLGAAALDALRALGRPAAGPPVGRRRSATRSRAAPTRSRRAGCCTACDPGRSATCPRPRRRARHHPRRGAYDDPAGAHLRRCRDRGRLVRGAGARPRPAPGGRRAVVAPRRLPRPRSPPAPVPDWLSVRDPAERGLARAARHGRGDDRRAVAHPHRLAVPRAVADARRPRRRARRGRRGRRAVLGGVARRRPARAGPQPVRRPRPGRHPAHHDRGRGRRACRRSR